MILCYFVTADPPTVGHRGIVSYALRMIPGIRELRVIPPRKHVWGKVAASFDHRFAMLSLAMSGLDPRIHVSSFENSTQVSGYSVDTLDTFKRDYPGEQFGILIGSDAIDTFHLWKEWERILAMAVVYVCPRGSKLQAAHEEALPDEIKQYVGTRIVFLPDVTDNTYYLHVSSTDVRAELGRSGSTDKVSVDVMNYIRSHSLYGA